MAKTKEQKKKVIADLTEKIKRQKSVVFVDFGGLDSTKLFELRGELKNQGCQLKVVKKTLLKKVLEALKEKDLAQEIDKIEGQLALAFGFEDEIAPAQICWKFAEGTEVIKILGGVLGKEVLTKEKAIELAKLPSKQELLARLAGSLSSPIGGLLRALRGNLTNLVYVLNGIQKVKS